MKLRSSFPWFGLCMVISVLVGCQVKRPDGVLPESKMENLLYDYHIAQALGDNLPYSDNYKKTLYVDAVFKKYGTTQAVFDTSMVWYTRHTEVLSKIYERVSKRLKGKQEALDHLISLREKKVGTSLPGDSIDVWYKQRIVLLSGSLLNNRITFTMAGDTNFKERDTLLWNVRYRFPEGMPDSVYSPVMTMQIVYKNDSTIGRSIRVWEPGMHTIRLQSDTLGEIKEIKGYIYYPGDKVAVKPLLTDHISLLRYHEHVIGKDSLNTDSLRTDSLRQDSLRADSLKKTSATDTVRVEPQEQQRLSPDEMNRPRSGNRPQQRKPEAVRQQPGVPTDQARKQEQQQQQQQQQRAARRQQLQRQQQQQQK